ncbi:CAP domain-containing protein [Bacillus horti]|uniref:Uncharacterized protein YkwD n=1 Tax=Caldalkalibacillus horti TaxID=77523 RepID=A0ABT9W3N4_9BACI|nr:CAP domain-containing protein [Bacillus horti]MDQ0167858.1 uncharacterized protein YkwD [Bacillus horti]
MRGWKWLLIGMLLASGLHIYIFGWNSWTDAIQNKWIELRSDEPTSLVEIDRYMPDDSSQANDTMQARHSFVEEDQQLFLEEDGEESKSVYLGMKEQEILNTLGEPQREEPSAYGYTWWVYNDDWETYIQVGVKNGELVTLYTNAPKWSWNELSPGLNSEQWEEAWEQRESVSFNHKLGYYTFDLTSTDIEERPLSIVGDTAIQLYIDIHNNQQISAIRLMDTETLLLHRPYALKYIGQLPEAPSPSEQEWKDIEQASERQIFDIINITRVWYDLDPFEWHGEAAEVARGHSSDMGVNDYFDHVSPTFGDLGDRLQRANVAYSSAGENIAWNYVDGPDAHQGWLNSLGHRKNVMEEQFTHLGVGVIEKHFTQNFLRP